MARVRSSVRSDRLTDDQRWRAVEARDQRFDGAFIVGVRSTGIYCRPSCPTPVQPLRKNVEFHRTTASAQRAGLRACKRCRPDASPGSPEWSLRDDLVGRAMRAITAGRLNNGSVPELARDLGVTERHLRRLMIDAVGAPPLAIARAQRAQTARTLIETTTLSFTDVAFAAGFQSLRQFNGTIREVFSATPTELRAKRTGADIAPDAGTGELVLRLPYRHPLDTDLLFGWHERRARAQTARVRDGELTTALRLPGGPGLARLRPGDGYISAALELKQYADLPVAVRQCRSVLDLDADPAHIDTVLGRLTQLRPNLKAFPGVRSPGTTDGFATLVFAIIGQQRSVAAARTMATRISEKVHGQLDEDQLVAFPGPEAVAELDLDGIGLTRRNVATIHEVAERAADGRIELTADADRAQARAALIEVKGIGPWTADYVLMRALGDPDVALPGDLIAARSGEALGLTEDDFEAVRPWRSYLTHRLWLESVRAHPDATAGNRKDTEA